MYEGPCLMPLLFDVLVGFQLNPIGIIADIEKAYFYLQITVADCHHDILSLYCSLTIFLKIFLRK